MKTLALAVMLIVFTALPALAASTTAPATSNKPATQPFGMTPEAKDRAERMISIFENDTQALQYDYIEDIRDGRGYTAGRAGFTTGTSDFLDVVERYTKAVPDNALAPYLPRLREIDKSRDRSSTKGLTGIIKAWQEAAKDPRFRAIQDQAVDDTYYRPGMRAAQKLGLKSQLALAAVYDTMIQHGGIGSIAKTANAKVGGTPATGVDEKVWLAAFLDARRAILAHAPDEATRAAWAESVDRVDVFKKLLADGNMDLKGPFKMHANGHNEVVK